MATVKNNTDGAYKSPAHYKQHNKAGTYRRITTYPKTAVCIRIMSLLLAFITAFLTAGIMPGIVQDVYAWFDGSGMEGDYVFGSQPLTDYVDLGHGTPDDSSLPHAGEAGYTKVTSAQEIYRLTRTAKDVTCSNCGADIKAYTSYWGCISDDGTIYVLGTSECCHCGACAFGHTNCDWSGHDGENLYEGKKITFTAWVPNSYTLTFYPGNGESSSAKTVTVNTGDNNTASVPAKAGYSFGGWYTQKDGRGTKAYDASGKAAMGAYWSADDGTAVWRGTSDTSLYAYWIQDSFTVTLYFDKNGTKGNTY